MISNLYVILILFLNICSNLIGEIRSINQTKIKNLTDSSLFIKFEENSACYINRWAFESLGEHIYDPYCSKNAWSYPTFDPVPTLIDPSLVEAGDIIFVRNAKAFFEDVHPHIQNPYILLTSGDYAQTFKNIHYNYLNEDKVLAWFTVHPNTSRHPKLHAIPLGIDQRRPKLFNDWKQFNKILSDCRKIKKEKLLYVCYSNINMKIRKDLKEIWANNPEAFVAEANKSHQKYFEEMATCKFTLCPPGYGPDSYRVWEALLVGSIPVVQNTNILLNELYADLPIVIVDDLRELDVKYLKEQYKIIKNKKNYNYKKLYVNYWQSEIEKVREDYLSSLKQK